MQFSKIIFFIFIAHNFIIGLGQIIYFISPLYSGCGSICSDPFTFDSLALAFNQMINQTNNDYVIILLPDTTDKHYLLAAEYNDYNLQTYYYNNLTWNSNGYFNPIAINIRSLIIKPLLCEEYPTVTGCYNNSQYVTIYLKTEIYTIQVSSMLNISNVILDGSENIFYINNINNTSNGINNDTKTCLYSRERCCSQSTTSGSSITNPNVICYINNLIINNLYLPIQGIFSALYTIGGNDIPKLSIKNSQFNNLILFNSPSLFIYDTSVGIVHIDSSTFSNNFFLYREQLLNIILIIKLQQNVKSHQFNYAIEISQLQIQSFKITIHSISRQQYI